MTASAGAAGLIKQATHVHQEEKKNEGKLNERFGKKKENDIVTAIKTDSKKKKDKKKKATLEKKPTV